LLGSALNEQGGGASLFGQAGKNFPPLKLPSNFCPPVYSLGEVWTGAA